MAALDVARAEAERLRGPLTREPTLVTDDGQRNVLHRTQVPKSHQGLVRARSHPVPHAATAGVAGAVPCDAENGGGLLKLLPGAGTRTTMPCGISPSLQLDTSALGVAARRSASSRPTSVLPLPVGSCRATSDSFTALSACLRSTWPWWSNKLACFRRGRSGKSRSGDSGTTTGFFCVLKATVCFTTVELGIRLKICVRVIVE